MLYSVVSSFNIAKMFFESAGENIMKKLLVMLLLAMSAVVFTVGCGDDCPEEQEVTNPEHILTVKQLEELLETKTAAQIFEEDLINGNRKTNNDIFCIDAAGLSFLLEKGLDVNAKFETVTVLHVAAYWGDLGLVKDLIGKGADVNAKSEAGFTVLHVVALSGNLDLVKYLVEEKNLDVNAKSESGWTVLHSAAGSGNLSLVKYLVENGANVNAKDDRGRTPANRTPYSRSRCPRGRRRRHRAQRLHRPA